VTARASSPATSWQARGATTLAVLGIVGGLVLSCRALEPSSKPVDHCREQCVKRASRSCSEAECSRGCEFILDRLVERELTNVLSCVVRSPRRCTDEVWADCAAHIGPHWDGGPPAPANATEEE
jgi:hypothetical protein